MSKIADRIILRRLQEETDDLYVISNYLFGFRRGHSTTHQMLRIVEQIKGGFNLREYTGAVFLDVAEAFDKVRQQGEHLKIHRAGISKPIVLLVHSYLPQRAFKVKGEGQRSAVRTVRCTPFRCLRNRSNLSLPYGQTTNVSSTYLHQTICPPLFR
ncbi:hypothetical protein Trydic_g12981 [Trypoxylus dichotomus]